MTIKTKLNLGVGLLFSLIVLLAIVSTRYINLLSNDTKNILVANHNSLNYTRNMLLAIDNEAQKNVALNTFKNNLQQQQHNITEIGEQELTNQLVNTFNQYKQNTHNQQLKNDVRKAIYDLMKLNTDAIARKSLAAQSTVKNATIWITLTATGCFLIAFSLLINFPGHIANPIRQMTNSIKQIAEKNYRERLYFEEHNEFGELAKAFNTMAKALEEYDNSNIAKLLFEKRRIEAIINQMQDPIIGLDENLNIIFANQKAIQILAIKEQELIGKQAKDISLYNDLIRLLLNNLLTKQQQQEPLRIYCDNKESFFEQEFIAIQSLTTKQEPQSIGHVIRLKNITPFKELDTAKTNFIGTISHELKTPIASILMGIKLLEDKRIGNINPEQKQLLQHIKDDGQQLLKITSELLDLTQAETGKINLNMQATHPKNIIQYATGTHKMTAEQNQIKLITEIPDPISNVQADIEKTTWVLTNLIINAIRYSNTNSNIIIKAQELDKHIQFSVQDFGKGIDTPYLSKIFERYFKVPGNNQGTGLGLAISKEFIEAQGVEIRVESNLGEGSTFYFTLNKI